VATPANRVVSKVVNRADKAKDSRVVNRVVKARDSKVDRALRAVAVDESSQPVTLSHKRSASRIRQELGSLGH
jgi:hypothetical protein